MPTEAGAEGHGHSPGTPGTPSSRSSRKDPPPAQPDAWICTSGLQKPAECRSKPPSLLLVSTSPGPRSLPRRLVAEAAQQSGSMSWLWLVRSRLPRDHW